MPGADYIEKIRTMKKNNVLKFLGIALVVAIVSTGIFYGLIVTKLSSNAGNGKVLVVAAKALKPGTELQASDLKTIPWPADNLPKGSFGAVEQVAGNTVIEAIAEEEPVTATHLASATSAGGTAVPSGMRAVSVHVTDSSGVLSLLRAGQKVDVQVVSARKDNTVEVRTALENLNVLAVKPQAEQTSQGQTLPSVTLLVKPAEADILAAADSGARVRLALRNPLDDATRSRSAVSLDSVMHSAAASNDKQ